MPRKKSRSTETDMQPLKDEFLAQAAALWDEEEENMTGVLERSETSKIGIGFHVTVDTSESAIKVSTRIAFGEKYSDERVSQLDVDQGKFTEVLEAAGPKGKKRQTAEESAD